MNLIDCQSHIFSHDYAKLLMKNTGTIQARQLDDSIVVRFNNDFSLTIKESDYAPSKKLADMDACCISMSIISPNIPSPDSLDIDLREEAAHICNDYTADLCHQYPNRFKGLAVLPFSSIEAVMSEYSRAIYRLGLSGIALFSNLGGRMVDDPYWDNLYAAAAADGIPIVLHPTVPTWANAISDYSMIPMIGFMVDHSFAMLRLILSGIMEKYPNLRIVQPHCGGVLPYVIPRIDEQTEIKHRGRDHITQPPSSYYRKVYLDIVSPSAETAKFALNFSGSHRLLFGSDHPWITIESMVQVIKSMGLTRAQFNAIGYNNAAALFNIPYISSLEDEKDEN